MEEIRKFSKVGGSIGIFIPAEQVKEMERMKGKKLRWGKVGIKKGKFEIEPI